MTDSIKEKSWQIRLKNEQKQDYFLKLSTDLKADYKTAKVFPPQNLIYNALELCPFQSVKVVILGQDPYHGQDQAHGLSFSVPTGIKLPPSLRNIFKEIESDTGLKNSSGNLENWAKQGVLLLNSTLTVLEGQPGSHQNLGWQKFTDEIIRQISIDREHVVFILWGKHAATKASLIDGSRHLILEAPHPSPFSAYKGFFGCKHFSQTNTYLKKTGQKMIDW